MRKRNTKEKIEGWGKGKHTRIGRDKTKQRGKEENTENTKPRRKTKD